MVPTLIENCFLACLFLHSHSRRVAMKGTSLLPHVGQITPSGQRSAAKNLMQGVRVGEEDDGFLKGARGFHEPRIEEIMLLSQLYNCPD